MAAGLVAHTALKHLIDKRASEGMELSSEDVTDAIDLALREDSRPGQIDASDVKLMVDKLTRYAEREIERMFDPDRKTYIDSECEFAVPYKPKVNLLCILDLVESWGDGGVKITDWKWSDNVLNKAEVADHDQLLKYGYAVVKNDTSITRVCLSLYYLKQGFEVSVELDAHELLKIEKHINYVLDGIEAGDFAPRINDYCHNCSTRGSCEEYEKRFVVNGEAIESVAQAHEEDKKVCAGIKNLTARKTALRAFLGEEREQAGKPLAVEDGLKAWDYITQEGREIDMGGLVKLFAKNGLDISPLVSITSDNLKEAHRQLFARLPQSKVDAFKRAEDKLFKRKVKTMLKCVKT